MSEITPIEFWNGDYMRKVANSECIVWYRSEPIQWVKPGKGRHKDTYSLCRDDGGDYLFERQVGAYEVCLRVEDTSDIVDLRQRIMNVAEQILDKTANPVQLYTSWLGDLSWLIEREEFAAKQTDA